MASRKTTFKVLLFSHNPDYVTRYQSIIKMSRKDLKLFVCRTKEEIARHIEKVDIIFSGHTFPVEFIANAKRLRWIQSMSAGVENFLQAQFISSDIILTRVEGVFGPIMSEYVIGYLLALTQNMKTVFENQNRHVWKPFIVDSLQKKTVGVMGLGSIGSYVAYKLYILGVEVIGFDEQTKNLPYIKKEFLSSELEEFLKLADFVVITMPLTSATRGLLGRREFDAMKKTAFLINISRGPIVQERALLEALKQRKIAGAVLDVFETEPLPASHEYWQLNNLIITPHIAGPSIPEDIAPIFLENLKRFEEGKPLRGVVDRKRGF